MTMNSQNAPDVGGALHNAAYYGNSATVLLLLEENAPVDHLDDSRQIPLHKAASQGHDSASQILLEFGAALDARDKLGNTPLDEALKATMRKLYDFL
jgi:ankyrin repeat protein